MSFVIMFPYFELFKHAMIGTEKEPLAKTMIDHWIFFFLFLPVQFAIAIYLTYFEARKMFAMKDPSLFFVVFYNAW